MAPLMIAGLVAQGLGSGFGAIKGAQMMKQAKAINPAWNLKESQAAKQMLGTAQTQLNVNQNLALGCSWRGFAESPSDRRYAFASIGLGMDATEAVDFYDLVQAFEVTLGRQA